MHLNVIQKLEKVENVFLTEHRRPKEHVAYNIKPLTTRTQPKIAVVIQGPIIIVDNFTLETILLYKKNFKNTILIVSTWIGEDEPTLLKLKSLGIEIILNEKPLISGHSHINYQIKSSITGIKRAKELGAKYVMKTRADQRIYGLNTIEYFLNLIASFPLRNVSLQKERLIIPSINTFLFRLYGITDMMMFGNTDDMILYWNAEPDNRVINDQGVIYTGKSFAEISVCEVYLSTQFLKKTGRNLKWTIEDSWSVYAESFCCVDYNSIDLFWPKYLPHTEFRNRYYSHNNTHQLLTFNDWFSIYNKTYHYPNEKILTFNEGDYFDEPDN